MAEKDPNVIEQAIDLIVGAVSSSADAIVRAIDTLVEKGKISRDEASRIVKEVSERGRQDRDKMRKKLESTFEKIRHVSRTDFEDLKKRVDALEKKRAN